MQMATVVGHGVQVAAKGFDLFQPIRVSVIAVRTAPNAQVFKLARQIQFRLIPRPAPCHHHALPHHAFECSGRRREAQIEITLLGRELAERAHRDVVSAVRGMWR
jgi:hypothetical protein